MNLKMYTNKDHTFVIPAYKDSVYLEECILSLLNQTVKSNILMITSTPNKHVTDLANKYNINLLINKDGGLSQDWNFGYNNATSKLVTIAHQDDIYEKDYLENILKYANLSSKPIIIFSDYFEIRDGKIVKNTFNLNIKRLLNFKFKNKDNWSNINARKNTFKFGNPICCPSVTLNKEICGLSPFDSNYKSSSDYNTWSKLANVDGDFVYIPKLLIGHRIHKESTTTKTLENNIRQTEDAEILARYWSKPVAKLIYKIYSISEKSNSI